MVNLLKVKLEPIILPPPDDTVKDTDPNTYGWEERSWLAPTGQQILKRVDLNERTDLISRPLYLVWSWATAESLLQSGIHLLDNAPGLGANSAGVCNSVNLHGHINIYFRCERGD